MQIERYILYFFATLMLFPITAEAKCYEGFPVDDVPNVCNYIASFPTGRARQFAEAVLSGSVDKTLEYASMLRNGVNTVGAFGHTALDIAAWRNDQPMMEALLKAGARPDGERDMAPIAILPLDNTQKFDASVRMLLHAGANINGTYRRGTATDGAADEGNNEALLTLIALKADINTDYGSGPPIIEAARGGYWTTVRIFLQYGVSLWTTDRIGETLGNIAMDQMKPGELAAVLFIDQGSKKEKEEKEALEQTVVDLKKAGFPWPAPGYEEIRKMQAEHKWPPK